jgi:RNA polymerase sigma-70 factor, ECF subfamily
MFRAPTTPTERVRRFELEAMPHAPALFSFAHRLEGNRDAALDLVQETWLRAFRSFDGFAPGTNARAWLFRILYRIFLNGRRTRGREVPASDQIGRGSLPDFHLAPADWDAWTGGKAPEPALAPDVIAALADVAEPFRSTVLLIDAFDLDYEGAATVMEVPIGTIRSRVSRGRRLLLAALVGRGIGPNRGGR